jgi:hypothetical protein
MQVVHDLFPHVDGGAVLGQRALDRVDGPIHSSAISAGGRQEDLSAHPLMVVASSLDGLPAPGLMPGL